MYNCVIIRVNNRPVMIMNSDVQAQTLRTILTQPGQVWHNAQVNIDWAYIADLPF